jgi:hypothetical protein
VSADSDDQAEDLDRKATKDESGSRGWGWEKYDCGNRQKETGWHDQQSRVFHSPSLSGIRPMEFRPPDPEIQKGSATFVVCN